MCEYVYVVVHGRTHETPALFNDNRSHTVFFWKHPQALSICKQNICKSILYVFQQVKCFFTFSGMQQLTLNVFYFANLVRKLQLNYHFPNTPDSVLIKSFIYNFIFSVTPTINKQEQDFWWNNALKAGELHTFCHYIWLTTKDIHLEDFHINRAIAKI